MKRSEEWKLAKKEAAAAQKLKNAENRKLIYKRAEQYSKEYLGKERELVTLKREAMLKGGFYVPPEAKLLFIILIPGINVMDSKTRSISQLFRLRQRMPNEPIRKESDDMETLAVERVDGVTESFIQDLKQRKLEEGGWPLMYHVYSMSKMVANAYARVLAKKNPEMYVNYVHPGYVDSGINWNTCTMTVEERAKGAYSC